MEGLPQIVNIDSAYKHDGMKAFSLRLKYADGTVMDLSGASITIPILDSFSKEVWTFSTSAVGTSLITADSNGYINFPNINSWNLNRGIFIGDVSITDSTGFVFTYLKIQFTRL